jgi:hypothetical protein
MIHQRLVCRLFFSWCGHSQCPNLPFFLSFSPPFLPLAPFFLFFFLLKQSLAM